MSARTTQGRLETAYHLGLGLLAWGVLVAAVLGVVPGVRPRAVPLLDVLPFLLFGLAARVLAFRLYAGVSVSVDSAFYIAAVLTLGTLPAALLATASITVDAAWRLWRRFSDGTGRRLWSAVSFLVFRGSVPGALLIVAGALFGVDRAAFAPHASQVGTVLWLVPALSLTLLVPHYLALGLGLWFEGHDPRTVARRVFLPALGEEMLLIPLSMVVVLVYDPGQPFLFLLLGFIFVLVNVVVKLLAEALESLERRVVALQVLGDVGRTIAANLDLGQLIPQIARETIRLVGSTSQCMVVLRDEAEADLDLQVFDAEGTKVLQEPLPPGEGLTGEVMRRGETLRVRDLQARWQEYGIPDVYNDPAIHSWMGTPLIVHDEVIGVLNVQAELPGAYSAEQARVFETIAAQAAVAIQNARLYALATVDGLTELYVRRYFDLRLRDEVRLAERYGSDFSMLIMDLDDFKDLNDAHGHPAGDRVLAAVAAVVKQTVRASDIPCRYGGEEFTVIMPRTPVDEAAVLAERVRQAVAAHEVAVDGLALKVTVSIGVAGFATGAGTTADVVRRADEALYRAKATGKNRVEVDTTRVSLDSSRPRC